MASEAVIITLSLLLHQMESRHSSLCDSNLCYYPCCLPLLLLPLFLPLMAVATSRRMSSFSFLLLLPPSSCVWLLACVRISAHGDVFYFFFTWVGDACASTREFTFRGSYLRGVRFVFFSYKPDTVLWCFCTHVISQHLSKENSDNNSSCKKRSVRRIEEENNAMCSG